MYGKIKNIHFVGIGGIGMSGIAEVLLNMGYSVTGSDIGRSATVNRLEALGAKINIGHKVENVNGADVVVTSSAIKADNSEVEQANNLGVPVIPRAEMLAELMRIRYGVAVAGSHGKTTVTSMIGIVLSHGGLDPTIVVGGRVRTMGTNARLGKGDFIVVEADESDGSFLLLSPVISVLTNVDQEHMDHYESMSRLEDAFYRFVGKIPFYGLAVLCADCPRVKDMASRFSKRGLTYGFDQDADLCARDVVASGFEIASEQFYKGAEFNVVYKGSLLGRLFLRVPGRHNAQNALAAVAVGMELGMSFESVKQGLMEFRGIDRRLQVKGALRNVLVMDDYAHHPQEIRVTINTLKESQAGRIVVIFQPHRYSRTKLLFDEFKEVLINTDVLFLMDIYPAGEEPVSGVSSEKLCGAIRRAGHKNVFYLDDERKGTDAVIEALEPGDVVITLGAGNVWAFGERIVKELE